MVSTNGHVFRLYFKENLLSNVNKDGINGSIQALKKLNGQEQKIKNYFNLPESFPVNGEQLLLLLEEHQLNATIDMKSYLIWHKESQ